MRLFLTTFCLVPLLCVSSAVLAGVEPMSEEEMYEVASLVAHGEVTAVSCDGEPKEFGSGTTVAYVATLTLSSIEKGEDDIDTVTLPFAVTEYDNGAQPMCGWEPRYRLGDKGLYYLVTGAMTENYTLVDPDAFVPDADSAGEELPLCGENPEDPMPTCEEIACGPCEICEGGECYPSAGHVLECEVDADCGEGATCVTQDCESFCVETSSSDAALCEDTGGTWEECMYSCGPLTCDNYGVESDIACASVCREECACPAAAPIWTAFGCAPVSVCGDAPVTGPSETSCVETGGTWDECAMSSCDGCDDCIAACVCPANLRLDAVQGCVALPTPMELCIETGGTEECVAPACPEGESCASICMLVCSCPEGMGWNDALGCIEQPTVESLCETTGGDLGCDSECEDDAPDCRSLAVCTPLCTCADGQVYDDFQGCVAAPTEVPNSDVPEGGGEPVQEDGGEQASESSGCAGGGSGSPDLALLFALCLAFALTRRQSLAQGVGA